MNLPHQDIGIAISAKALFSFLAGIIAYSAGALFLYVLGGEVSNDVNNYNDLWHRLQDIRFFEALSGERFEVGFLLWYWTLAQVLPAGATFYVTGFTALSAKYYLFNRYVHYPLLAWLIYAAIFLHVLDANQIRAALATCFILYAFLASKGGSSYLILAAMASFFHWSGLIILLLYTVCAPLVGLASIVLVAFSWNYIVYTGADVFGTGLTYLSGADTNVHMTSSVFIAQLCISAVCAFKWNSLTAMQKKGAYLLMAGVVFYVSFYDNAVMAHRLRELSMLGVFPLLFLGERKMTYPLLIVWLCVGYIVAYDLWFVLDEFLSLSPAI